MRRTIGIPVQLIICEPFAFSLNGKSLGICASLLFKTIRYGLLRIFFPKLHEWVGWVHPEVGPTTWADLLRFALLSFVHCALSSYIPMFVNVASARLSQNAISIERYRSTAAESSARACSSDPLAPQT